MMAQQRVIVQEQPWTTLIEDEYAYNPPRRGRFYEAVILTIAEKGIIVDLLGTKRDGIIPSRDLEGLDQNQRASLQEGDRIPVVVLKEAGQRDDVIVSLNQGLEREDWTRARQLQDSEGIVQAPVTGVNRGGVLASLGRLQGFVPNSHLTSVPRGLCKERQQEAKARLVGQTLSLVVIEVVRRRRRLVLSERQAGRRRRTQLLGELNEGDIRTGIVCNLTDFGAFVDLGGIDGLIHVSELDEGYVKHPGDVLQVGQEVQVYVLDVDKERERVSLSRKRLLRDPGLQTAIALPAGELVKGTVTAVSPFGLFVDIGQSVEGWVPMAELPKESSQLAKVEPGSQVTARVLEVDERQRQIALRLEAIT
jgi:small subunit ribosomal protein S1